MNRGEKSGVVDDLIQRFNSSSSIYLTDFTGLSVKVMTDFRRQLREAGVDYVVVKNTLATRALHESSVKGLEFELSGPNGFVLIQDDPTGAARIIKSFQKEFDRPAIKAGMVDGQAVTPMEIDRLASLPGKEMLLGQLGGVMQAPLQAFVGAANGLLNQFVAVVEALRAGRS